MASLDPPPSTTQRIRLHFERCHKLLQHAYNLDPSKHVAKLMATADIRPDPSLDTLRELEAGRIPLIGRYQSTWSEPDAGSVADIEPVMHRPRSIEPDETRRSLDSMG